MSQNHIPVFITYHFVEVHAVARTNVPVSRPPCMYIFIHFRRVLLVGELLPAPVRHA